MNFRCETLNNVELKLRSVKYKDLELGSLLSCYLEAIRRKKFNSSCLKKLAKFIYYLFFYFFKKKITKDLEKEIIYFSSGNQRHLCNLKKALMDDPKINNKTLFIAMENNICKNEKIFYSSGIIDFFQIFFFLVRNIFIINKIIRPLSIPIFFKFFFFLELQMQILKGISLKKFIKAQKQTKLISADFDRGYNSALFFSVSKSLKITSFVLQHGSFNYPNIFLINADEYWVWGEMAKKQLLESQVYVKKITITGSAIVEDIKISQNLRKQYEIKKGINVVLALSRPIKKYEIKLVKFLSYLKKMNYSLSVNYFTKIHPSRKYHDYEWIRKLYNIDILPIDISYQALMNITDILLTDTSDLAGEAFYFDKKVCILDILSEKPFCNLELNKYFNLPLITKVDEFKDIFDYKMSSNYNKEFLFYKIGYKAKTAIQNEIKKKLENNF